jgi:hypothetical protein
MKIHGSPAHMMYCMCMSWMHVRTYKSADLQMRAGHRSSRIRVVSIVDHTRPLTLFAGTEEAASCCCYVQNSNVILHTAARTRVRAALLLDVLYTQVLYTPPYSLTVH